MFISAIINKVEMFAPLTIKIIEKVSVNIKFELLVEGLLNIFHKAHIKQIKKLCFFQKYLSVNYHLIP